MHRRPHVFDRRAHVLFSAHRPVCEQLERRALLCGLPHEYLIPAPEWSDEIEHEYAARNDGGPDAVSIVWTNRGQGSDNFTATFGTSAPAARAVVDAALEHWERVITSWNRSDSTTTLQISISISGTGFGGAGAPAAGAPADGKPRTGAFTIGAGDTANFPNANDSNGWYFDPNPNDHSEFNSSIINAFAGSGTGLGADLYSVVVAEMTHILGLISDKNNNGGDFNGYLLESSGYVTNTGVMDSAEGGGAFGRFWVFEGPTIDHLMTSYNSGDATNASWGNIIHSAGIRPALFGFNNKQWQGSEDAGNALYANNERTIPSWAMAHVLQDAYGYSIVDPEAFGTFYTRLNRTTGALVIDGGDAHETGGISNDSITLSVSGSDLVVSVDVSNDIPGTRHLSGPGNLPAWTTRVPINQITSIVINAGNGSDSIIINGLPSGMPLVVNAGAGDDQFIIGGTDYDTNIRSNITLSPGTGVNTLLISDVADGPGSDESTITSMSFSKILAGSGVTSWPGASIQFFSYEGTPNADTINMTSGSSTTTYSISGFDGADTFRIGGGAFAATILGQVSWFGGGGNDTIVIQDDLDTGNDIYQVSGNQFSKPVGGGPGSVTISNSTENMVINGGTGANDFNVPALSPLLALTINGNSGSDTLQATLGNNFDANLQSALTFNGGGGNDAINVLDASGTGATYNFTIGSLDKGGAGVLNYAGVESWFLVCSNLANTINVNSTAPGCETTINGAGGDDIFVVNDGSSFLFNFGGNATLNGGNGNDTLQISDTNFGGGGTYTVLNGRVDLPFNGVTMFHNTMENLSINGSNGANTINVNQTNLFTFIIGDDGDDTINLGNGDFAANILANVLVIGSAGADTAHIQDSANNGNNTWTVIPSSITHDGATAAVLTMFLGAPTIDSVVIHTGAGGSTFNVNGLGTSTTSQNLTVNAGGGNDVFEIGTGSLSASLFGNIVVNGEGGSDSVVLNDATDTGADAYNISGTSIGKTDWAFGVSYSTSTDSIRIECNGANNTINVNATNSTTAYRLNGNNGVDTFNVFNDNTPVVLDGGSGFDVVNVNTDNTGTAQARFVNDQTLQTLAIGTGGNVSITGGTLVIGAVGTTGTLAIPTTGQLNIGQRFVIVRHTAAGGFGALNNIRDLVASGATPPQTFNGPGINSSTAASVPGSAVGYSSNAVAGFSTFGGIAGLTGNEILVRYTLKGDATLDGTVNGADFNRLAPNFGQSNKIWSDGDFTYDFVVNSLDFNALAPNFGQSVPGSGEGADGRPVAGGGGDENGVPSIPSLPGGQPPVSQPPPASLPPTFFRHGYSPFNTRVPIGGSSGAGVFDDGDEVGSIGGIVT